MRLPFLLAVIAACALPTADAAAGDVKAGEARYKVNCVNCHGKQGQGMASFPAIAGRDAAYIADRLNSYRAREMVGPNSAIMMSLARDLSDAEIADLAAYIATTLE
ncbi:MAG: c-type cytochrome [Rhodovibrio sp.]|nr:c-type cytochrome [Rhodovibrio sp.]